MIAETTKAWCAGIVDGEGYIGKQRPVVRIDNTDVRILQKLVDRYDGTIYLNQRKGRPKAKPCWYWRLCGQKCIIFLTEIEPYLVSKRAKAQKWISGQNKGHAAFFVAQRKDNYARLD
jgi:hypothetical protein